MPLFLGTFVKVKCHFGITVVMHDSFFGWFARRKLNNFAITQQLLNKASIIFKMKKKFKIKYRYHGEYVFSIWQGWNDILQQDSPRILEQLKQAVAVFYVIKRVTVWRMDKWWWASTRCLSSLSFLSWLFKLSRTSDTIKEMKMLVLIT